MAFLPACGTAVGVCSRLNRRRAGHIRVLGRYLSRALPVSLRLGSPSTKLPALLSKRIGFYCRFAFVESVQQLQPQHYCPLQQQFSSSSSNSSNQGAMVLLTGVAGVVLAMLAAAGAVAVAAFFSPAIRGFPAAWMEKHLFPDPNQIVLKGGDRKQQHSSKVYRILAFGDSLTEGFTEGGNAFHPYAKRLGDFIYQQMPKDWHLQVEEQGESGERVLLGMKHRLQRTLDEHAAAQRWYDWVLLLGGINDLAADDSSAEEVLAGLDVLVQMCLAHGTNVLLMTLTEVAMPVEGVEEQRRQLNALIKDYVVQEKWDKAAAPGSSGAVGSAGSPASEPTSRRSKPRVHLFDLAGALPFEGMPEEQRWELWDDGVHLTMAGYDRLGELVGDALLPLLQAELQQVDAAAAAAPAAVEEGAAAPDKKEA
ncbi:SGNH hydrolase-type esterase domain-containing protein [Scenedesmus sp. NREL 46B-D3]|nr:SGNH hydrolase-type esterase domain-containing protein [Scenedesmus sp. NREL 46B-D3]